MGNKSNSKIYGYENKDFERKAASAIDQAIIATQQTAPATDNYGQELEAFLIAKKTLVASLDTVGDKDIYKMGSPLGFNLLHDFSALSYTYFGNFTSLRSEAVLWRLKMLQEILNKRRESLATRVKLG